MAQWVPKTAWRLTNLNKRYGPAYLGLGPQPPNTFAATEQPTKFVLESEGFNSKHYSSSELREKYNCGNVAFIDLRSKHEQCALPLLKATALHPHDLLSGACNAILPQNKEAELFLVATNRRRCVNGFNALRRWGFANVVVVDFGAVQHFDH